MTEKPDPVQGNMQQRLETGTAPSEPAGHLWALSPAEWRSLVITFLGGLGSIVAAACVIGGAIALDRVIAPKGSHVNWWPLAFFSAVMVVTGVFLLWAAVRWAGDIGKVRRFIVLLVVVGLAGMSLLWIGLAAGIH